ncbi:unnamed protein product [Dibothriocephalus latus]|uniref:Uncharacterized protein n=1 Tax=Dibothriocephalus latus TaxID=60516 RepID=A0A3P7P519_DIBLA|nr:unnamed protein product [Dibothriocephalus latus]
MEQASNIEDTQKVYAMLRLVSGRLPAVGDCVHDVIGSFRADEPSKVMRGCEHFEHRLNFEAQLCTPSLSSALELHNSETPREDGIRPKMHKCFLHTLVPWLHNVIEQV